MYRLIDYYEYSIVRKQRRNEQLDLISDLQGSQCGDYVLYTPPRQKKAKAVPLSMRVWFKQMAPRVVLIAT